MMTRRDTIQVTAAAGLAGGSAEAARDTKKEYLAVYHGLIADWGRKDIDAVLARMTDDIVWHYLVGLPPLTGKAAARGFLEKFGAPIKEVRWRIFDAAVVEDRLMVEGVDEYLTTTGGHVVVPYMGILTFRGGLVSRWRDYCDSGLAGKMKNGEAAPDYVNTLIDRKAI